jgi:hypothetical protein
MPRQASIDLCGVALANTYAPGVLHHIIVRGIDRRKIFSMMPTVTIFWIDSAVSCPTVRLHFCMGVYDKSLIIEITRRRYRHGDEPALDRLQGAAKSSKNRG